MSHKLGPAPVVEVLPTRLCHVRPVIAWATLGDRDGMQRALVVAAEQAGLRPQTLRVLARQRAGSETIANGIAASPDALELAVREAIDALPPHDVLLAEGAAAVAVLQADVALLVTHDRPVTSWPESLRAVRSVLDLVLIEPRPGVLTALLGTIGRVHAPRGAMPT